MWSETPAVAVMSYRLLKALGETDLVDMMYFEDDVKSMGRFWIAKSASAEQ